MPRDAVRGGRRRAAVPRLPRGLRYPDPPEDGPAVDPTWPPDGLRWRAHRGGSWQDAPRRLRSAGRGALAPADGSPGLGLRLVRRVGH